MPHVAASLVFRILYLLDWKAKLGFLLLEISPQTFPTNHRTEETLTSGATYETVSAKSFVIKVNRAGTAVKCPIKALQLPSKNLAVLLKAVLQNGEFVDRGALEV